MKRGWSATDLRRLRIFLLLTLGTLIAGCGSGSKSSSQTSGSGDSAACTPPPASLASPSGLPTIQEEHVFIVMEENHSPGEVIGNDQAAPYLNSLAASYAYATGYFANAHPSLPNYFMLTTGQTITTTDSYSGTVDAENVEQELGAAGDSWKAYVECLPAAGYTGEDTGCYSKEHNPFAYFSDLQDAGADAQNVVPFSQLATDISNSDLPNYGFIVPDPEDDGHSCPNGETSGCTQQQILTAMDEWLKSNVGPLIQDPDFDATGHGLLIITFDEGDASDTSMGGGSVPWVAVGADVKPGYTSDVCFQHQSTLRFMLELLGVTSYPGEAASAPSMRNFLTGD